MNRKKITLSHIALLSFITMTGQPLAASLQTPEERWEEYKGGNAAAVRLSALDFIAGDILAKDNPRAAEVDEYRLTKIKSRCSSVLIEEDSEISDSWHWALHFRS